MFTFSRLQFLFALGAAWLAAGAGAFWFHQTNPAQLLRRGRAALERGDTQAAERLAARLEERGSRLHSQLLQGEIGVWEGRSLLESAAAEGLPASERSRLQAQARDTFRRALKELTRILDDGPAGARGTVLAAECLIHLEERGLAANALRQVVHRHPDEKEAHRLLAAIHIDLHTPFQAIGYLREWGRLDPSDGRPYRWIGFFYRSYTFNQWEEAVAAYREACRRQLQPAVRAEVLGELAETLIDGLADYPAALEVLDQGAEVFAESPEVLTLKAECYWGLGQAVRTVQLLDQALRAKPDLFRALLLRVKVHLADKNPQAALPLLEKAVQLNPHDLASRQYLMQTCRLLGDFTAAEHHQRRLEESKGYKDQLTALHGEADRNPWDDQVRYRLAELCLTVNRPVEARQWLQAALACNPGNQQARAALDQLAATGNAPANAAPPVVPPTR
jgi:tetratricopeptide (TPR) repeat protein